MLLRHLLTVTAAAAALVAPAAAHAATYYVDPSGSDSASGTSPASAWRTVTRVDRAALAAGDNVLFAGGARFADQTLMPPTSGSAGARITFGSYGTGQAVLSQGIWFTSRSWLVFDNLAVDGAGAVPGIQ